MPNLDDVDIPSIDSPNPDPVEDELDRYLVRYVLDQVIDLLEGLVLTGNKLIEAERVLREVEELRRSL